MPRCFGQNTPWNQGFGDARLNAKGKFRMTNLKKIILMSGRSAVLALTGCEMLNHHEGDRTAGRALDDKTITATVQHDLNREPVYKFNDVDVKTFDSVVQLSGFVPDLTEAYAQASEGVTQVVNNITLKSNDNLAPTGRPNHNDNDNDDRNYNNNPR